LIYFFNLIIAIINYILYTIDGGDFMTIEQKLNMALSYKGISQSELARRIGTTPQNLNQKIKRNTLTKEELEQIATALDGIWKAEFVFPDGVTI
jgi:transcriptional regulator with XRE-family HTH domain